MQSTEPKTYKNYEYCHTDYHIKDQVNDKKEGINSSLLKNILLYQRSVLCLKLTTHIFANQNWYIQRIPHQGAYKSIRYPCYKSEK